MQKWMKIAESRLGTKEIKGDDDNLEIVGYFADVGHGYIKDDETAWCAAFVGSCLEGAGLASTRALNARSYLDWGRKIIEPVVGCVGVLWRDNPSSWKGHTGFVTRWDKKYVWLWSGNSNNEVNETRYLRSKVLGYRMPKTAISSKTNWAAGVGGIGAIVSQADEIGKTIDKVTSITKKGGDLADQIGGVADAMTWPLFAFVGVVCIVGFIIYEREKKRRALGV